MATSFDQAANQYNVTPRLIVMDESNGNTLTRATIRAWTPTDIESMFFKEIGMDRIIANAKEARMAGVRERTLKDLLLSRHVTLRQASGGGSRSIIAPFDLVPRENVVNASYFQIEAGAAHPTAGQGDLHPGAWKITVNLGSSPWVAAPSSGLKNIEKYFLPGHHIAVEWVDTTTNVSKKVQLEIVSAVNANSGSTQKAIVTVIPNRTSAWWVASSTDDKAPFKPTYGQVSMLVNSVSDYESYGHQTPGHLSATLAEYWQQTIRWAHSYNEEYVKALQAPLTSDTLRKFRLLDLAKQRKQQEEFLDRELFNTFWFGEEINEKQTIETYTQLPEVRDLTDQGLLIEYKANTLGVRTQLARAARINDRQGGALDIDAIQESCYNMKRNRQTTGGKVDVVDAITDRHTAARIRDIMIKFYKAKYSMDVTGFIQPNQKVLDVVSKAAVLNYNLYDLPDQGVQLAVFTEEFFDDRIAAFNANQKNRARSFWMVDWSDVAINVVKTASAKRMTDEKDELYRFVIKPNLKHTQLNSKTIEVRVGDPNRSQVIENYSDAQPAVTVSGADLG